MHEGGFRRWLLLPGALAAAALLGTACEREQPAVPETGSEYEGRANEQQTFESFVPDERAVEPGRQGPLEVEERPATGGSGRDSQNQGANTTPDEFQRPQQQPPPGQGIGGGSQQGIGAPGYTTPQEQPTDQGGTRRFEEGDGNTVDSQQERGPRSPPRIEGGAQQPQQ